VARAEREEQRKLLRDSLPDVDRVPLERFKGWLIDATFDLMPLLAYRTINQGEAVRNATRYRFESNRAGLHKIGLECRLQQDDFVVLAAKLDDGGQTLETKEIKAPRQALAFVGCRLDALTKGLETEAGYANRPGKFRYYISQDATLSKLGLLDHARPLTTFRPRLKLPCRKLGANPISVNRQPLRHPMLDRRAVSIRNLVSIFATVSTAVAIAGCATDVEQRGNLPAQDKITEIHPGTTTKDEVTKILGSPSSTSVFNDKTWYYISRRTGQFAFFDPSVLDQQVYVITFDDQGVVQTMRHKSLDDGREITPVARATPAPGRELSFLEQVVGNLGKFNSSAGSTGGSGTGHQTGRPDK
jgi:outer membrane protein assembly factor BamE (lipoprotein component of BamABCDE complex)